MLQIKQKIQSEENAQGGQKLIGLRRRFNGILQGGELQVDLFKTLDHSGILSRWTVSRIG